MLYQRLGPMRRPLGTALALLLAGALASCASKLPPPPPPPPPPPVVVVPPRPEPPEGAARNLITPPVEADGVRESVNRKVSGNQMLWNLRSAYTVAALGCQGPLGQHIQANYRVFLTRNAAVLKTAYNLMDHEFRERYGRGGETLRDDYLTVLYNHYALPPTAAAFCDIVDKVMSDGVDVPPGGMVFYAQNEVPLIEKVFDDFYDKYDRYRNALAAWEEKYGHGGRVTVGPLADQLPLPPAPPPMNRIVPMQPIAPMIPAMQPPMQAPVSAPMPAPTALPTTPPATTGELPMDIPPDTGVGASVAPAVNPVPGSYTTSVPQPPPGRPLMGPPAPP